MKLLGYLLIFLAAIVVTGGIISYLSGRRDFEEFFFSRPRNLAPSLAIALLAMGIRILSVNTKLILAFHIAMIYPIAISLIYLAHMGLLGLFALLTQILFYFKLSFFSSPWKSTSTSTPAIITRNWGIVSKTSITMLSLLAGWMLYSLVFDRRVDLSYIFDLRNDWSVAWYSFVIAVGLWFWLTWLLVSGNSLQNRKG